MLFQGQGGRFSGGATYTQGVGARCDLVVDELGKSIKVNVTALVKWGDEGGAEAGKDRRTHIDQHLSENVDFIEM